MFVCVCVGGGGCAGVCVCVCVCVCVVVVVVVLFVCFSLFLGFVLFFSWHSIHCHSIAYWTHVWG